MDPSAIQVATVLAVWLWPLWKPGAEEFSKQVGKWLGTEFTGVVKDLLRQIDEAEPERTEQVSEKLVRLAQRAPQTVDQVVRGAKTAIRRLLRNSDLFVLDDLVILADELGYSFDRWGVSAQTTRTVWVDQFVNQAWADGKAVELVQAIQQRKPHLFT